MDLYFNELLTAALIVFEQYHITMARVRNEERETVTKPNQL